MLAGEDWQVRGWSLIPLNKYMIGLLFVLPMPVWAVNLASATFSRVLKSEYSEASSHAFESVPLTVMLEYNPDQYDRNVASGGSRPTSPWSAGFTWHALPGVDLRLSVQHGDEIGVGFRSYLLSKKNFRGANRSSSCRVTT